MSITTIFDDFFRFQPIALREIAMSCRKCNIDNFIDVCVALCAFFGFNPKYEPQSIRFEFVKALAYNICRINGNAPQIVK